MDSNSSFRDEEQDKILREMYYNPSGYYRSADKFYEEVKKQGYDFELTDVRNFLHRQAVWQMHAPYPNPIKKTITFFLHFIYSFLRFFYADTVFLLNCAIFHMNSTFFNSTI